MKTTHTVAVIDGGGRGAALVHAYAKSPQVRKILAIPGNDFMQENSIKPIITYPHLKTTSVTEIVALCKTEGVSLVDVAQDNAVAVGLTDALLAAGIAVLGPTKKAGEIEWNKAYSREFMQRHAIMQPEFFVCHSVTEGIEYLKAQPDQPWFVKAAGLAEGKGVLPATNNEEAQNRIVELQKFGEAGKTYLLEKWLKSSDGSNAEEFSSFAISDGITFQYIGSAQDHKRVSNMDVGENTGGMGCSNPPLVLQPEILQQVENIFKKVFSGLQKEARPYKGILYLGGIILDGKVYVIEFNARWGDPEAEIIIPGITNDFFTLGIAVASGTLKTITIKTDNKARVVVAGVAKGYPTDYTKVKGKTIFGLSAAMSLPAIIVYGAGIKKVNDTWVVNGGRVFYIIGTGENVIDARKNVYDAMKNISIADNNLHYRTDIGWRDVQRLEAHGK